jgi:hypothetical protein
MIELDLAEGSGHPVPLQLRTVRGSTDVPASLDDLIVVGEPLSRPLTKGAAKDDNELSGFIEAESGSWRYHLITFSCTFAPSDDLHIASAWLQIVLANGREPDAAHPIATSMEPVKLDEIRPISATAKITIPCVFVPEISLTGSTEIRDILLEARYEGTSKPAWHFNETRKSRLSGIQRLRLIVRTPVNVNVTGILSVGATVRYKRFGVRAFSYRSQGSGPTIRLLS